MLSAIDLAFPGPTDFGAVVSTTVSVMNALLLVP